MSRSTLHVTTECLPATEVFLRIGDKWTLIVVARLWDRPQRFSELRRVIPSISQRMLTLTLRELERDGLISRIVTPTSRVRVDYQLTEMGRSLGESVRILGNWAFDNHRAIEAARSEFDQRQHALAW